MRILYGITKSNFGGAQRYVFDLAVAAQETGHEVAVLCGGNGQLVERLLARDMRVISVPDLGRDVSILKDIKSFIKIFRILLKEKPDVFHINSSKMGFLGALLGRIAGVRRIIFTAHGWAFNEDRHWVQKILIEELAWNTIILSHKTICVSDRLKYDVDSKPFVEKKLAVIHNGVEKFPLLTKSEARAKLLPELPQDALVVGTLAELHHTKGLDIALRSINKVGGDVHFAVCGTGENLNSLKQLAQTLGIRNRVHFLGFVDNARENLKAFDIFTLTSRTEGLPYVILEAGIAELPVVATNIGGIPEVIKDDETGFLFPKEDHKLLAEKIKTLIDNPEQRRVLGTNLNKSVLKNFSQEKMVTETLSLYR